MSPTLPLFADEGAAPARPAAQPPRGLVPLARLAKALGERTLTLKRRFKRADKRLGGRLLWRSSEGAHWHVRLDILREELPELVTPQAVDELEAPTDDYTAAVGVASELREMRESIAQLTDEVRWLRDFIAVMAGKDPNGS